MSQESCCRVVRPCPIHFPVPRFFHPSGQIRQSRESVLAEPSIARALYKNPRFLQTLAALALPSSVHIPRAAAQSCRPRDAPARSPCTHTSPSLRSTAPLLFLFAPSLLLTHLLWTDARQVYAIAIPTEPTIHPPASIRRVAAARAPSTSLPDRQTPVRTKPASPSGRVCVPS